MPMEDLAGMTDPGTYSTRLRHLEVRLTSHEDVCAERYERIRDDFDRFREDFKHQRREVMDTVVAVRADVSKTNHWLIRIGVALLVGMAGILAKMVFGS